MMSKLSVLALGLFLMGCNETPPDHEHGEGGHAGEHSEGGHDADAGEHAEGDGHDADENAKLASTRPEVRYYLISEQ